MGMKIIPVDNADDVLRLALDLEKPEEFLVRKGIADVPIAQVLAPAERPREEPKPAKPASVKH